MQRLSRQVRLVTATKRGLVRGVTQHGPSPPSPCSWQIEYIRSLTCSQGYLLCLTADDTFFAYNKVQFWLTIRFQPNQLVPATLLWPLKLICVMFSAFCTVDGLMMVCFLLQKLLTIVLIVKVCDGHVMLPIIHRHLLSIGMASSKSIQIDF